MAVTRANVENVLVKRLGPLMTKAGQDGTTVDGTNTDLADPIAWALRTVGYTTADITNPTTAEVASAEDDIDQVVDLAEFRALGSMLTNLDDVDVTVGPRSEKLSQLAAQVQKRLDSVKDRIEDIYGYGASSLETGVITYEFAEHATGSE
jgi:hypothetical protein